MEYIKNQIKNLINKINKFIEFLKSNPDMPEGFFNHTMNVIYACMRDEDVLRQTWYSWEVWMVHVDVEIFTWVTYPFVLVITMVWHILYVLKIVPMAVPELGMSRRPGDKYHPWVYDILFARHGIGPFENPVWNQKLASIINFVLFMQVSMFFISIIILIVLIYIHTIHRFIWRPIVSKYIWKRGIRRFIWEYIIRWESKDK
jgi:hypothetical protein